MTAKAFEVKLCASNEAIKIKHVILATIMQLKFVSSKLKGALNPNFLNFTKNREKFCL